MEISFNTSRIPDPEANQPVARSNASSSTPGDVSPTDTTVLTNALKEIPLVRPDKVEQARALVASGQYPPTEVLDGIAHLLALNLKP